LLKKKGFDAAPLHGDMSQPKRMETLDMLRKGNLTFLVASDVAARGLDIPKVSHIFNYDVPVNPEDYIHRIGRTGRAGRPGRALMLVTPEEGEQLGEILRMTGETIPWMPLEGRAAPEIDSSEQAKPRRRRQRGGKRSAPPQKKAEATPSEKPRRQRSRRRKPKEPAAEQPKAAPSKPQERTKPQEHAKSEEPDWQVPAFLAEPPPPVPPARNAKRRKKD